MEKLLSQYTSVVLFIKNSDVYKFITIYFASLEEFMLILRIYSDAMLKTSMKLCYFHTKYHRKFLG